MRRAFISIILLAELAVGTQAPAERRGPLRLEPTSKWVLDYGDERCSLLRQFGSGDDVLLVRMDSYGSWDSFRVTLSGKSVPSSTGPAGRGGYRFPADRESREARLLQGTMGNPKVPAVSFSMRFAPDPDPDQDKFDQLDPEVKGRMAALLEVPHPDFDGTVDSITVAFGHGTPVELHVGSMAAPLAEMRTCVDDLYKSWGVDPARQKTLSAFAEPLRSTVRRVQGDYPVQKLVSGVSAYVPVRLMVDANGAATSCVVQSADVDAAFKAALCENLQERFKPALDQAGRPVPSMFHTSVFYLIGGWG